MSVYLEAIFLGLVEGLTEFLPISSTAHLLLIGEMLRFEGPPGKTFEIVIQLGAILAICVAYRSKLWSVASNLDRPEARIFVRNILLAFLPAGLAGALLYKYIRALLDTPVVAAIALIVGGFVILAIERMRHRFEINSIETLSPGRALAIGCCQMLAMVPGVSRAGATIMGSLLLGLDRRTATEFSFFLAIPTMIGAATYSLYKNWAEVSFDHATLIAAGFCAAFLSALLVVQALVAFVGRHGFAPFAWYRMIFGGVMLALLLAR